MLQDLPLLVLNLIYDNLSYEEVLVLRCTCKRLKEFVDGKKFTKLNLFVAMFACPNHRLFHSGDWVEYPHSYQSNDLAILTCCRFRQNFVNVQKMMICIRVSWVRCRSSNTEIDIDLNSLNWFTSLTHLEINEFYCLKGKLSLPELQIASFVTDGVDRIFEFALNCPKLKALKLNGRLRPALEKGTNQLDYLQYGIHQIQKDYLKSISANLQKLSTIATKTMFGPLGILGLLSDLHTGSLLMPALRQVRLEHCGEYSGLDKLVPILEDLKSTKQIEFVFIGRPIRFPCELEQFNSLIRTYGAFTSETNFITYDQGKLDVSYRSCPNLLFLERNPELHFLIRATSSINLCDEFDLNEQMIEKLKNVKTAVFNLEFKPSYSTLEMFSRTCKSLRYLLLSKQTVTERLLEMMSRHLVTLQVISIYKCNYETIRPLVKFRNLDTIKLDFKLTKDELTFLYEKIRWLGTILFNGKRMIELQRTIRVPKLHQIKAYQSGQILKFPTLPAMIDYFCKNGLFKKQEKSSSLATSCSKRKASNCSLN